MTATSARVAILRLRDGRTSEGSDLTAAEVPLEVRLQGRAFAVIMRTPGADRALAAGFLLAERIIRSADDLATIEQCDDEQADRGERRQDVVSVVLEAAAAHRAARLLEQRREVMASAACGVCGRSTIDALRADLRPLDGSVRMDGATVLSLPQRLRAQQPLFDTTGGLHAAGLFTADGTPRAIAEDVGRHNAVDKVTGTLLLREELPAATSVLCVSGRTSFEIVQKAWCAGVTVVASVSAPSSLAVSLADDAGITLVGFVRDGGLNIYTHPSRIA
ncbi:MAG TPA: formate dehydrogenase accessory sulfurtransferase FdhD [Vicinamibacterales bacterium]|nr:formate dehydrogenase accessory sulfurtransferase FdhD [Vicinamibacterales bacterium]